MEITIFLAKFWGSLFMILGAMSVSAKLLGRIIEYTEDKTITISTGYITFLLGLHCSKESKKLGFLIVLIKKPRCLKAGRCFGAALYSLSALSFSG
jgi:hypothetical protein